MTWLIIGSALKRSGSAILTWLGQRSFWQLAFGAVAIFALLQHFTIAGERRHSAKLQSQLTAVTDQLHDISTKRNEQHSTTTENIKHANAGNQKAAERAKVVEQAPLPGNCKTPPQIMSADI